MMSNKYRNINKVNVIGINSCMTKQNNATIRYAQTGPPLWLFSWITPQTSLGRGLPSRGSELPTLSPYNIYKND